MIDETIEYFSKQDIGVIISQGLAETYKVGPKNPVDFLGKWLLHNTEVQTAKAQSDVLRRQIQDNIEYFLREKKIAELEKAEIQKQQQLMSDKEADFYK